METYSIDFGTSTTVLARLTGDPAILPIGDGVGDDKKTLLDSDVAEIAGSLRVGNLPANAKPKRSIKALEIVDDAVKDGSIDSSTQIRRNEWVDSVAAILLEVVTRAKDFNIDLQDKKNCQIRMGCPASWTSSKRNALLEAADKAGLSVFAGILTDEAVAAALPWYASNRDSVSEGDKVVIFDMGGGTTDIAVLTLRQKYGSGELEPIVLSSRAGSFAGDKIDEAIARIYKNKTGSKLELSNYSLLKSAERTKWSFADVEQPEMSVPEQGKCKITLSDLSDELATLFIDVESVLKKTEFQARLIEPALLDKKRLGQLKTTYAKGKGIQTAKSGPLDPVGWYPRDWFTVEGESVVRAAAELSGAIRYEGTHVVLLGGMSLFAPIRNYVERRFPGASIYIGNEKASETPPTGAAMQTFVASGLVREDLAQGLKLDKPNVSLKVVVVDENGKRRVVGEILRAYESFLEVSESRSDGSGFGTDIAYQIANATPTIRKVWRPGPNFPTSGYGLIVAETPDGKPISMKFLIPHDDTDAFIEGDTQDGLVVAFGEDDFRVMLNPNGFIVVFAGDGRKWGLGVGFPGLPVKDKSKTVLEILQLAKPAGGHTDMRVIRSNAGIGRIRD